MIDRRKMILDAATQSFAQYGYKATTMELVAKIANVGKGTIYTFFSTKDELFEEIINNALQELKTIIDLGIKEEDSFMQNCFRLVDMLMEFRDKHELFVKLAQENRDIGTYQAMAGLGKMEKTALDYVQREIDKAIAKGEVKPCDAKATAFIMLRLYITLTADWSRYYQEPMSNESVKEYIRLILFEGLL